MPLPSPQELPRDLHLHRLAPQRALEPADLPAQLVGLGALGLARQPLGAGGEELLAPLAQQALGDVVLATELRDRLGAAQRREHQLGLLLRAELPVAAGLAHGLLLRRVGAAMLGGAPDASPLRLALRAQLRDDPSGRVIPHSRSVNVLPGSRPRRGPGAGAW